MKILVREILVLTGLQIGEAFLHKTAKPLRFQLVSREEVNGFADSIVG